MVDELRVRRLLRSVSDALRRLDVDDSILVARLGDLSDLDAFLRRVAEWLPAA